VKLENETESTKEGKAREELRNRVDIKKDREKGRYEV